MRRFSILVFIFILSMALLGCSHFSTAYPSDNLSSLNTTATTQNLPYQGVTDDGSLAYEVVHSEVKITGILIDVSCVVIPAEIDGYPVTVIGSGAFYQKDNCSSVTLPESLHTIESGAFYRCYAIADIQIPAAVTSIASDAFFRVENLRTIRVAQKNSHYRDVDGVLFSADMTELVLYPEGKIADEYRIPDGVQSIRECAFGYFPAIKKLVIPQSVIVFPNGPLAAIVEEITIVSDQNPYAEDYASRLGVSFEHLQSTAPTS